MSTPKINGLPSLPELPEGHRFLLEGEKRCEGLLVFNKLNDSWHEPGFFGSNAGYPLDPQLFYCAPIRKSYAERQEEWIAKHGIKEGSKVRITRVAKDHEDGWENFWPSNGMIAGNEMKVLTWFPDYGIRLEDYYSYPYFVLEPIVEPKRVPLEDKDWAGGPWWVRKSKDHPVWMVLGFSKYWIEIHKTSVYDWDLKDNWERSRDGITWTPCSKEEA